MYQSWQTTSFPVIAKYLEYMSFKRPIDCGSNSHVVASATLVPGEQLIFLSDNYHMSFPSKPGRSEMLVGRWGCAQRADSSPLLDLAIVSRVQAG